MLKSARTNTLSLLFISIILIFKAMTKKALLVAVLILGITSVLNAAIVTVKQDGTGDYTTIEAGMNESVWNSGDTVLVWPGVYYAVSDCPDISIPPPPRPGKIVLLPGKLWSITQFSILK